MPITDAQLGWIAGFFDGEGHVSYKRSYISKVSGRVSPMLMCSIAQASSNIDVLEHFQSISGLGKIKGPYKMPNGKPQHRLIFGTNEIETLFGFLKPNLRKEKTEDFERALKAYNAHDSNASLDDYKRTTNWMKKKGLV